jgi:hypothetical protein
MRGNPFQNQMNAGPHGDLGGLSKPIPRAKVELESLAGQRLLRRNSTLHLIRGQHDEKVFRLIRMNRKRLPAEAEAAVQGLSHLLRRHRRPVSSHIGYHGKPQPPLQIVHPRAAPYEARRSIFLRVLGANSQAVSRC